MFIVLVIFVTFPCGILGQVWYLIVSFPDLCRLSYFYVATVVEKTSVAAIYWENYHYST